MKWDEFSAMLAGIGPETPLGRMVTIRSEDDPDVLKEFTPEMRRIRTEWRSRMAKKKPKEDRDAFLESIKNAILAMAGQKHPEGE